MLTAYDATMARLLDRAGLDVILVGDSLGTVILGQPHTLTVTLEAMIHHTAAVARGTERALVVADMPFLTYQVSVAEAVRNAGRLLKEGGAAAVKLEGGKPVLDVVRRLVDVGIPVMGHLGLQPQSVHLLGGYTRRGTEPHEADALVEDAVALEHAGAFAIVLEAIPSTVARTITARVDDPDDRHRVGSRLRRTGPRELRHAGPVRSGAAVREAVRQPGRHRDRGHARVRGRCPGGRLSTDALDDDRPRSPDMLDVVTTIDALRLLVHGLRESKPGVGFVPTMGALHAGHVSLIEHARRESGTVVVSIFVNPLQFDRPEDLDRYPRTLDTDVELCRQHGVDVVFAPSVAEMYPRPMELAVDVGRLADHLCGRYRPGHFQGVASVVLKLFGIVLPDVAYFGEKDAQQLAVVRRLVTDFNVPVRIVSVPTVREPDGLALSSRNVRLSAEERQLAPILYAALQRAAASIEEGMVDGPRSDVLQRRSFRPTSDCDSSTWSWLTRTTSSRSRESPVRSSPLARSGWATRGSSTTFAVLLGHSDEARTCMDSGRYRRPPDDRRHDSVSRTTRSRRLEREERRPHCRDGPQGRSAHAQRAADWLHGRPRRR